MQKTMIKALAIAALLVLPSQVLAAAQDVVGGSTTPTFTIPGSSVTIAPSNKVTVRIFSNTVAYGIKAAHEKGDRVFGTNHTLNRIFWINAPTTIADGTNFALNNSVPTFGNGWSAY